MFDTIFGKTQTITLALIECASCGLPFGITEAFQERRRNDHVGFMCPNGHSNVYSGKSKAEKLQDQVEQENARAKALEGIIDRQRTAVIIDVNY